MADQNQEKTDGSMTGSPEDRGEASGGNMGYGGAQQVREKEAGKDEADEEGR